MLILQEILEYLTKMKHDYSINMHNMFWNVRMCTVAVTRINNCTLNFLQFTEFRLRVLESRISVYE